MLVHQSQAGCIIGKAGSKIKELREVSTAAFVCLQFITPVWQRYRYDWSGIPVFELVLMVY